MNCEPRVTKVSKSAAQVEVTKLGFSREATFRQLGEIATEVEAVKYAKNFSFLSGLAVMAGPRAESNSVDAVEVPVSLAGGLQLYAELESEYVWQHCIHHHSNARVRAIFCRIGSWANTFPKLSGGFGRCIALVLGCIEDGVRGAFWRCSCILFRRNASLDPRT